MTGQPARVAVIGAGIAGLACARTLHDHGAAVSVFEKESVPGGRAATLIDEVGPFDHGAQYFTAENDRFVTAVRRWESEGIVQQWRGRIVAFNSGDADDKTDSADRFVPVPGMRRLGVHLAKGIDVRYSSPVTGLRRERGFWHLQAGAAATPSGPFDAVCVAVPSLPACELLGDGAPLVELARTVQWDPCWAALMALPFRSGAAFDAAFFNDDPILGWAALDSAKPRRGSVEGVVERWVLHARPGWSRRYANMEAPQVAYWMARALSARLRRTLTPLKMRAIFWPQATPLNPLPQLFVWDERHRLGVAGDWCGGPRVEGAFLSGQALAEAVLG